jgi:endo-1,4-beta-xylanase
MKMRTKLVLFLLPALAFTQSLRDAGAQRGILVGTAADYAHLGEADYTATLSREFSVLEAENEMKWAAVHPSPAVYTFSQADRLVAFAQANRMKIRGHNLCWHSYNPSWLTNGNYTPDQLSGILQDHINTEVTHYKGQVFAWDVVNEALADGSSGQLRDSIWYNQPGIGETGYGYIVKAFQWAHAADPDALLFYNDYSVEDASTAKSTAMYNMLKTLLSQGVPIHGVGLQAHLTLGSSPSVAGIDANLARLTALGLQVQFTELDVRVPVDSQGRASDADLAAQAQKYRDIARVCLKYPLCTLIQTWGFTDKYSWVPSSFAGFGAALPFDTTYQSKPAYQALQDVLNNTPPVLAGANIVNVASYAGGSVAPGELVAVFGANLGPASLAVAQPEQSSGYPSILSGTQVFFDGSPAPIIYALVNQTCVVAPFSLAGKTTTNITYSYNGVFTNSVTVPVARVAPGLFAANAQGTGQGAILNQDNTPNSAANPAAPGSVVQLFGTGAGQMDPTVTDGQLVGLPLPVLSAGLPIATVAGLPASVGYAGPAPFEIAGMLQVNLTIPAGTPSGMQSVLLTWGGAATQSGITVAVK